MIMKLNFHLLKIKFSNPKITKSILYVFLIIKPFFNFLILVDISKTRIMNNS